MNGRTSGLGELGLFLLLAFILPGFVYLFFFFFYFPDVFKEIMNWLKQMGIEAFLLFFTSFAIVAGLLLTSICFAIEILLRKFKYNKKLIEKHFPDMGIYRLGIIDAKGKGSMYLYQVTGQAIMHANIFMGVFIIMVLYLIISIFPNFSFCFSQVIRIIIGLILIVANFYVAKNFYSWGKKALDGSAKNLS